ncbi:unnamed protein product, partial [Larinioides sclopetarius]
MTDICFGFKNKKIFAGINLQHGRRFKNGSNSCFLFKFFNK